MSVPWHGINRTIRFRSGVTPPSSVWMTRHGEPSCRRTPEARLCTKTVYEVAAEFNLDRDRVSKLVKAAGRRVRDHERVAVDLTRAAELQVQGLNITDVAKAMGIGRTTLVRARRAASK
jgi:hypothetical protein